MKRLREPETLTLAEACDRIGNQPTWALKNMIRALSTLRMLNTPEEEQNLRAAQMIVHHRAQRESNDVDNGSTAR